MARINTNVAALAAQRGLSKSQRQLNESLQRLSSGLRINRGADDPAGLIASEGLRSEIAGLTQAVDNSQRAANVIATTEGALNEIASLLLNIKDLVVEAANSGALSDEEIQANQLQVNSAIESITRISNTTTFAGLHLLNGSLDYLTSGVATGDIQTLHIYQASFGSSDNIPVEIEVTTSAQPAQLEFRASAISQSLTLEIRGVDGVDTIHVDANAAASAIAFAVNRISDSTGVTAELRNASYPSSGIAFKSISYGSKAFVSVKAQSGTFNTVDSGGVGRNRTVGQDAVATVNGVAATADGNKLKLNTSALDMEFMLDEDFGIGSSSFRITGGGAKFQLGPTVATNQQVNLGIQSVAASKLGDADVGYLNDLVNGTATLTGDNAAQASKIVERAIRQVAVLRGRLGAFERNTLQTNINSLSVALENVTASESSIRDADFARETSAMTRAQILTQAGTSVLATANSTPQSVLSLLQG